MGGGGTRVNSMGDGRKSQDGQCADICYMWATDKSGFFMLVSLLANKFEVYHI